MICMHRQPTRWRSAATAFVAARLSSSKIILEPVELMHALMAPLVRLLTETTRQSLERWIADPEMLGLEYLWPSRLHHSPHLATRQYARILRDWVTSIGL